MKDKMDLAIGVALGSSIQIAIFVIPFVCLVGWATGHHFYLNFEPFAVLVLTLAVIHAYFVSSDGQSHWLLGVLLVATYVLVRLQLHLLAGTSWGCCACCEAAVNSQRCLPLATALYWIELKPAVQWWSDTLQWLTGMLLVATRILWCCCQQLSCPPTCCCRLQAQA